MEEISKATHKVSYRMMKRCSSTQMTASSVIVASVIGRLLVRLLRVLSGLLSLYTRLAAHFSEIHPVVIVFAGDIFLSFLLC